MLSPLLLSIKEATVAYNELPIFENLTFNIHKGSRIALVGKNGVGKSTLMKIICGFQELTVGTRWEENNLTIGMLEQDILINENDTIFDFIIKKIKSDQRELYEYKVDIISKRITIPIVLWDERLSTVGAFNISSLLDVNVSKRTKKIDENAAAFILQGAIDYLNN